MRKKQLFALLMASALSVGMAPTAAFAAADTAVEAASEEVSGELDAADTEAPAEDPAETPDDEAPADETPVEDPAADPTETPAEETPAEEEETPAQDETDAQAAEADAAAAIVVGDQSYTTLADAFAAVPDTTDLTGTPTYVKVKGEIELNATVDVPATKNIMLVAAEDTTIKRAAGFTDSMFTVNGGNLQMAGGSVTDSNGTAIGSGSLTVDGSGDGVTGSIVEVVSGNYGLTDDAVLTGNNTTGDGAAINNAAGANVYILGGTITGNTTTGNGGAINNAAGANVYLQGGTITANSAAAGGAIYSEGTVNIKGTVSVTGNTVTNSFPEATSNLVLDKEGVINVTGAVTDSVIGVAVQEAEAGRTVVKLDDNVTDVKLADVLSQITYEGDSSLKLGEDGKLSGTAEPSAIPTPAEAKLKVTGKECKWSGNSTVKIKFQSNVKGTYYIDWVKRGEKAPTIDTSMVGAPIDADTNVTTKVTDLPDYDVDIYVCVVSDKDKSNYGSVMFQPESTERPVTPTPPHTAVVPNVNESVVQGFENALVFYPNTFYDFKVIGAGTQNNNPGEGDVRWVPAGWSMSQNPSTWNTSWKIGAKNGIYTDAEKAYTIYIKYNKQVYSGTNWEDTDASEILSYQFKAAPLAQASVTPGADGTNGNGTTSGDGTTDGGTTDVTPTTYANGTNGTSKSAVSTGDESPIGTMFALAAASVLAGGYVLVRRRKKER